MASLTLSFGLVCLTLGLGGVTYVACRGLDHRSATLSGQSVFQRSTRAQWQFDRDQCVSFATPDSRTMYSSVFPGKDSNFVLQVRVRLSDGAECRVRLGESRFQLTNSPTQTELRIDGQTHTFENTDADSRDWTQFTITRRDGKLTANVNGWPPVDIGDSADAIEKIGIEATRGTIAVKNFVLTGELERREAEE